LVILRVKIEERLHKLAEHYKIETNVPLYKLIAILSDKRVLTASMSNGLLDLVHVGNQAAHGAQVDPKVAAWVNENGIKILHLLDDILRESNAA
jgi:hypothetical protein